MKRRILAIGVGLVFLPLAGCHDEMGPTAERVVGSGRLASESRSVAPFTALTVDCPARVVLRASGAQSLEVTADDNVLPFVQSEVRDGRLFLSFASMAGLTTSHEVLIRVTAASLERVEARSAAQLEIEGIDAESLSTHLDGASGATLSGRVDRHELRISGASHCRAGGLGSRQLVAELSGASYALVRVSESLAAGASGVSVLEYHGDPAVTSNVSGGSVIRRVGP